jgi:hypothetical protein
VNAQGVDGGIMSSPRHHHVVLEDLLPQHRALRKRIPEVDKGFAEPALSEELYVREPMPPEPEAAKSSWLRRPGATTPA